VSPDAPSALRILHVEDDPNDSLLVGHAFRKGVPQAVLTLAVDGEEAQAYLGGTGPYADRSLHPLPHLVLLDLKLPKRTGLEVLEWMKSRKDLAGLPVFILSSSTEKSDVEQARTLGATGYLSKQGDMKQLVALAREIAAYLGGPGKNGKSPPPGASPP